MSDFQISEERIREIVKESLLLVIRENADFFKQLLSETVRDIDMASELDIVNGSQKLAPPNEE